MLPAIAVAGHHHGIVRYNGLPVPGATVIAAQGDKKFSAISDLQGFYSFPDLPDGSWKIQVEMLGFQHVMREMTIGAENPVAEWDLTMLPLEEIKTETARPVFLQTDAIAPADEVSPSSAFANLSAEQLSERSADGFLINGSVNNGAASPFAQLAAFGNNRRGFRSLYNGSIGAVLDNSALNARSFSLTGQDTAKLDYNRMQLSFNIGGPLKIPFLIRKNTTFFLSYQRNQNRNASILTSRMPTEDERNGDLSRNLDTLGRAIQIFDPGTGLPFAGNVIPLERISPQARSLLSLYPLPNSENGGRYNYQTPVVSTAHQDTMQGNVNSWHGGNQISGSFSYQNARSDNPNVFAFLDKTQTSSLNLSANFAHRFDQHISMRLGYQFARSTTRTMPYFADRLNVSGAAGISGNNQDPGNWGPPNLSFSNYERLTDARASFDREQTNGFSFATQINRGPHNVSVGMDFRRQQLNLLSQQDARGTFTFTGAAAGYDFADFLLGIPDTVSIAFGNADKYFRASNYALYINDDFRISSGFTLNGGIRWEYESPMTELYGRLVNLDSTSDFQAISPVLATIPEGTLTGRKYPGSLVDPDKLGVQPRIGFAWRPAAASSWVIRGGYGIYRETSVYRSIADQMAQQSPFSKSLIVGNSPATPLTLARGFDIAPNTAVNNFAIDPNFRVGNAQNWQLSIQRDLPGSIQIVVIYLGSKGSRLTQKSIPNTYPAGVVPSCLTCPTGFIYQSSNGESIRHAGQVQIRRRLRHGFAANMRYTFSKSIDDAALGVQNGLGGNLTAQNWLDLKAERSLSNFDQRHLLEIQTQYTSGAGTFRSILMKGWIGALMKEWTFAGNMTIGSGMPLTPIYAAAVQGTGMTGTIRPNRTGASIDAAPAGLFINPAAFSAPEAGEWGNAGRNSVTGPNQFSMDASVGRAFRLRDRYNVEFRLDSKNALNHVTFPGWNTIINSSQFGLPERANPMRTVVANLRLSF
jgi:trimeric autotransporter adhesin